MVISYKYLVFRIGPGSPIIRSSSGKIRGSRKTFNSLLQPLTSGILLRRKFLKLFNTTHTGSPVFHWCCNVATGISFIYILPNVNVRGMLAAMHAPTGFDTSLSPSPNRCCFSAKWVCLRAPRTWEWKFWRLMCTNWVCWKMSGMIPDQLFMQLKSFG